LRHHRSPFSRCQRIVTHPPRLNRNLLFHFKNARDHTRAPHRHDDVKALSPEVVRFEHSGDDAAYKWSLGLYPVRPRALGLEKAHSAAGRGAKLERRRALYASPGSGNRVGASFTRFEVAGPLSAGGRYHTRVNAETNAYPSTSLWFSRTLNRQALLASSWLATSHKAVRSRSIAKLGSSWIALQRRAVAL
jgi:hypothetical protein